VLASREHKFFYIRVPKTGSTSCALYLLDSGLIDDDSICGRKPAKKVKSIVSQLSPERDETLLLIKRSSFLSRSHVKHKDIISDYPEMKDYKSIACVRNPIDRAVSAAVMRIAKKDINEDLLNRSIEEVLASTHILSVPQYEYVASDTILWPTEDLRARVEGFILQLGGSFRGSWHYRDNKSSDYLQMLSDSNTARIHEMYAKDFELWQSAVKNAAA